VTSPKKALSRYTLVPPRPDHPAASLGHFLTAAYSSLPFGSRVRVTNARTGRSVVVRINDRGPFAGGRVIDLSKAAAQAVGISGVGRVKLTRL
jgi:peptidoglycan lytic transglycosylase